VNISAVAMYNYTTWLVFVVVTIHCL